MIRKSCAIVAVLCSLVLLSAGTQGAVINYSNFSIDGLQEVPPNASPAFGIGNASLDTTTLLFSWNISFSGLLGSETGAHFHGPAAVGVNAGPILFLASGSPKIGSQTISAAQALDVQNGLWYVNIHSSVFPGGEIRGQVVPEPFTLSLLGLGSVMVIRRRRRQNR